MTRRLALLALAVLAAACARRAEVPAPPPTPAAPAPANGAVLFVSADTRGYLAPCGCSENMRGGIARAVAQVRAARAGGGPVLFVDGGDSLFPEPELPAAQVPQEELKARTLAGALALLGVQARGVGEKDDARGAAFRRALGLPDLAPGEARVLEAGARKVGVTAGTTPEQLARGARAARERGADFVLGLVHQDLAGAQAAFGADARGLDLVVATHSATPFSAEENRRAGGAVPVVQLQSKGRSLLRVDLRYAPNEGPFAPARGQADVERETALLAERIERLNREIDLPGADPQRKALQQQKLAELVARRQALLDQPPPSPDGQNAFTLRFVPLEATLPSDPDAVALVERYDREVGALNLAWARAHGQDCPAPGRGEAGFVGSEACRTCHAAAFPVFEQTKHPRGLATLEEKGKQFHLDCVTCHVTGWGEPGGACRLDKLQGRAGVGCESCHGPGSRHVAAPSRANVTRAPGRDVCVSCHNLENSPHFDFATYVPRILGPGHGAPAAGGR